MITSSVPYSTIDAIFVMYTMLAFCTKFLKYSCCSVIDFSKAFDKIDSHTF